MLTIAIVALLAGFAAGMVVGAWIMFDAVRAITLPPSIYDQLKARQTRPTPTHIDVPRREAS